jgi:hypothetical protein
LIRQLAQKLENIPKDGTCLTASEEHATLLPSPAEDLQDNSSMEVTTMAISEARRYVEEDEQLTSSCYITIKSAEADTYFSIKPIIWVGADSITLVTMHRSAEYSLQETVDRFKMSERYKSVNKLSNPTDQVEKGMKNAEPCTTVSARPSVMYDEMYDVMYNEMYDEMYDKMYDEMYDKMCSTVFNRECRAKNSIYEQEQCRVVIYETV